MKRTFSGFTALVLLLLFMAPQFASAQDGSDGLGIGLMIGEPTGFSLKYWTSDINALDAGLAWSLGPNDGLYVHGDYLWHNYSVFSEVEEGMLPVYYGVGGRMIFTDIDAILGVRVPVGMSYIFEDAPLDLFLELAPSINLAPSTDFDMNGALGIRIYL